MNVCKCINYKGIHRNSNSKYRIVVTPWEKKRKMGLGKYTQRISILSFVVHEPSLYYFLSFFEIVEIFNKKPNKRAN